jgi:hypothetical protein
VHEIAGFTSLWVSICYLIIGGLIIPTLRFPLGSTVAGILFFLGCAFTHAHIAADVFASHGDASQSVMPPLDAWIMVVLHVVQGIGGTGFIVAISRKRLVVRLEK